MYFCALMPFSPCVAWDKPRHKKCSQAQKGAQPIMNKYNFDVDQLAFDLDQLVEKIEAEHGRMIVRIPKMKQTAPFIYEFSAIFSDFTLLEAQMLMIPRFTFDGIEAEIHVEGIYL
jgi:hypothetical protein